jgi:biopolymer transport protein ExbD
VLARLLTTARIGIGLTLLPPICLLACIGWEESRIWTPLNIPVSFSEGRIRTVPFNINIATTYNVWLAFDRRSAVFHGPYEDYYLDWVLDARWSASTKGRVVATETTRINADSRYLGNFTAGRGRYALDLEVKGGASVLNAGSPRLIIYLAGHEREDSSARITIAVLLCIFWIPIGVFTLIRAAITSREAKATAFLSTHSFTQAGGQGAPRSKNPFRITFSEKRYGPRPQTGAHGPLYPRLPTVSLFIVLILELIGMFFWSVSHPTPVGLHIKLLRKENLGQPSPGIQPLSIYVDRDHRLYVNGRAVAPDGLPSLLRTELPLRPPSWPVYVEGDPSLDWLWVVRVIDAVQAHGSNVVLQTSRDGYHQTMPRGYLLPTSKH